MRVAVLLGGTQLGIIHMLIPGNKASQPTGVQRGLQVRRLFVASDVHIVEKGEIVVLHR